MTDYHFMADVLTTFRSCPDGIKALIVGGFYATITVCTLGCGYLWVLGKRETVLGSARRDAPATADGVVDLTDERRTRSDARSR